MSRHAQPAIFPPTTNGAVINRRSPPCVASARGPAANVPISVLLYAPVLNDSPVIALPAATLSTVSPYDLNVARLLRKSVDALL